MLRPLAVCLLFRPFAVRPETSLCALPKLGSLQVGFPTSRCALCREARVLRRARLMDRDDGPLALSHAECAELEEQPTAIELGALSYLPSGR